MSKWITIECERVLYADRGRDVILCDRLPSPVTLIVKLAAQGTPTQRAETTGSVGEADGGPVAESDAPEHPLVPPQSVGSE